MKLIGITGRRRSGKDTAAEVLVQAGYTKLSFATGLKEMLRGLFRYLELGETGIHDLLDGSMKESPLAFLQGKSARHAMQTLGTEWGRGLIGENIWINICLAKARNHERVVICDVRFENEANAIQDAGGIIVRVERGVDTDGHESEKQDGIKPDYVIHNTGTIGDLHRSLVRLFGHGDSLPAVPPRGSSV